MLFWGSKKIVNKILNYRKFMFYKLLQHIGNLKHNVVLNDFYYVELLVLCLICYLIGQNIKDF